MPENSISTLRPGQRASIEVELLSGNSKDFDSDVICVISRVQKEDQQDYFKIHSVQPIEDNKRHLTTPRGEVINITTFGDIRQ